ncbi:hypothetical protein L208DRAFT_1267204, partial [Tricholoma matsutake]
KFFPHWDGPFTVTHMFLEKSNYTIHLPNAPDAFPTFHLSLLKRHAFISTKAELFPSHKHVQPGPIITANGIDEYKIEKIVDKCKIGHGFQYLI